MKSNELQSWIKLQNHKSEIEINLKDEFKRNPNRFDDLSISLKTPSTTILLDYSKNLINKQTLDLLFDLCKETKVEERRKQEFAGGKINFTENRSVLHTALRTPPTTTDTKTNDGKNGLSAPRLVVDGQDIEAEVQAVLQKMKKISDSIRAKEWTGYTGKAITDIINIGIGGSDLGPVMATTALKPYASSELKLHFVSNVDGCHLAQVLAVIDPETSLFIIASKTFTTIETLLNAQSAKTWFLSFARDPTFIKKHFIALSTNEQAVIKFGIDPQNMLGFWDWVGGRYSLWSAIGMSISISIGHTNFLALLQGAHEMDQHFLSAPLHENIPVILAILGVWYTNFHNCSTHAILPYDQLLSRLPAYLQQTDMESNGKSVDSDNNDVDYQTGVVVFGEPGTNGQHAFYQLIHQGTQVIPCDFLASVSSHYPISNNKHHEILISNFIAQTEALMNGKTRGEVDTELDSKGIKGRDAEILGAHKVFKGNKPTNSIIYSFLDPATLGALIAMYEHKVFVQGVIWNINSFDQWGVELGKVLAGVVIGEIGCESKVDGHDSSTNGLINYFKSEWDA